MNNLLLDLKEEGIECYKNINSVTLVGDNHFDKGCDFLFHKNNLPLLMIDILPRNTIDLEEFYLSKIETTIYCLENNIKYFIVNELNIKDINKEYLKLKDNYTIYIHNLKNINWKIFKDSLHLFNLAKNVPLSKTKLSKLTSKQVIVIRRDLMNPFSEYVGKMIAQGAHSSTGLLLQLLNNNMGLYDEPPKIKPDNSYDLVLNIKVNSDLDKWIRGIFTKVVVYADNEEHLLSIYEKALKKEIPALIIEDIGLTKFDNKKTLTALALGPYNSFDLNKITRNLKLV